MRIVKKYEREMEAIKIFIVRMLALIAFITLSNYATSQEHRNYEYKGYEYKNYESMDSTSKIKLICVEIDSTHTKIRVEGHTLDNIFTLYEANLDFKLNSLDCHYSLYLLDSRGNEGVLQNLSNILTFSYKGTLFVGEFIQLGTCSENLH